MIVFEVERQLNHVNCLSGLKTVADDPFAPLFNRSWFRRMWTIQEVTLAKMNKVFIYGGHGPDLSFQWITLTAATDALKVMKYPYGHIEKAVKSQRLLAQLLLAERLPLVRELLQRKPGNKISRPILWKILLDAREKESSDPRDKIFALFGVLEELKIQCPIPDYQKSIEDVYREAVVACINHDKNLKVLFDVPSDRRYLRPDLSSWVPDWSDEGWRSGNVAEARIAVTGDRFCAAGPADPKWSFSHDQRRLILSGKVLDSVIYCADPLNIDRNVVASLKPQSQIVRTPSSSQYTLQDALRLVHSTFLIVKSWAEVASWYGDYPTGETVQQALFRTLVADTSPENQQEPVAIDSWFRLMMTSDNEKAIQSHPQASKCYSSIAGFADRRALFTTEKGYMGTAPARITATEAMNLIQAGDMIAVVAGLEMPVALRPVEIEDQGRRVYQYVSHVYVHGIMYGEAWEDEKLALQDIVLL